MPAAKRVSHAPRRADPVGAERHAERLPDRDQDDEDEKLVAARPQRTAEPVPRLEAADVRALSQGGHVSSTMRGHPLSSVVVVCA